MEDFFNINLTIIKDFNNKEGQIKDINNKINKESIIFMLFYYLLLYFILMD